MNSLLYSLLKTNVIPLGDRVATDRPTGGKPMKHDVKIVKTYPREQPGLFKRRHDAYRNLGCETGRALYREVLILQWKKAHRRNFS